MDIFRNYTFLVAGGAAQGGAALARHCHWLLLPGYLRAVRHGSGRAWDFTRLVYRLDFIPSAVERRWVAMDDGLVWAGTVELRST